MFSFFVTCLYGVFFLASSGKLGEMPDFRQLENPKTNFASEIISSDNKVLGKYYFNENRTPIDYDELNPQTIEALIAIEDERFYSHPGIDLKATIRAIVFLNTRGGASTISQQLARQLFVGVRSRNIFQAIVQKIKEWVIAVELEKQYTKEEIITMYLNIYDFGYYGDGIKSASNIYFSKPIWCQLCPKLEGSAFRCQLVHLCSGSGLRYQVSVCARTGKRGEQAAGGRVIREQLQLHTGAS